MKRKIIFLDIDGTLTKPGCNIPPESAMTAIKKAQANGHLVFLCSGRNYDMLSPLLTYPYDGVIASCGGYVECQGTVIADHPMTKDQQQMAMDVFHQNGVFYTLECFNGTFTDDGFKDYLKNHGQDGKNSELLRWRQQLESSLKIRSMKEYQGQPVYKMVFMALSANDLEEPKRVLQADFDVSIPEPDGFGIVNGEIINRAFDKGRAVMKVCEYLDIPVEDTFGFGDSINDRELIETVGTGICMGNGSDALKEAADEICGNVSEDGLYHAFKFHKLI